MTLYYNHAGLTGDALHYAKIQDIFPGNPVPEPEWEGQLYSQGDFIYIARGNPLGWHQIKGQANFELPPNVVTYQISAGPPYPESGTGKLWIRPISGEAWLLINSEWKKLGGSSNSSVFAEKIDNASTIRLLNFSDGAYGFCLLSPVGNFGAESYLIVPWLDSQAFYGVDTPQILLSSDQYYGFVVHPTNWRGEENPEYFANSFKIFANFPDGQSRQTFFDYDDTRRIIEILGMVE